jgi:indolepyruvate ferredoxin oxidoreductase alpha subunit
MKRFLLGNEAIAYGAVEAGVDVASGYPGTPSSEILDTLFAFSKKYGYACEYAINEKVGYEVAYSAAIMGKRSIATMKHVGLNVAADPFFSSSYVGLSGGFVVVVADDPSLHSSQNEQDTRNYARAAFVPCLEPSSAQEAHELTKKGFEISERLKCPVILRTTTRISHQRGIVDMGEIASKERTKTTFIKNPSQYVVVPANARVRRMVVLEREKEASWISNEMCSIEGEGKTGILTDGVAYAYVLDALEMLGIKASVFKVTMSWPPPEEKMKEWMRGLDRLIVVEELDPYLEMYARAFSQECNPSLKIYGKRNSYFPYEYEFNIDRVMRGIASTLDITVENYSELSELKSILPGRPPVLCAGCAHRAVYYAMKKVTHGKAVYPSDIGCYTLALLPPLSTVDTCICMGASVTNAHGFRLATDEPIIATIGDSTFFHTGLPALLNARHNNSRFILIVLDNETTAMTGHQPTPGTGENRISIEKVVSAADIPVKVVDADNLSEVESAIKEFLSYDGVSVIVARRPCVLLEASRKRKEGTLVPYYVTDECNGCAHCVKFFSCPALIMRDKKAYIVPEMCTGCSVCAQLCPTHTIEVAK